MEAQTPNVTIILSCVFPMLAVWIALGIYYWKLATPPDGDFAEARAVGVSEANKGGHSLQLRYTPGYVGASNAKVAFPVTDFVSLIDDRWNPKQDEDNMNSVLNPTSGDEEDAALDARGWNERVSNTRRIVSQFNDEKWEYRLCGKMMKDSKRRDADHVDMRKVEQDISAKQLSQSPVNPLSEPLFARYALRGDPDVDGRITRLFGDL